MQVLAVGKGSEKNRSDAEEQITLALEFVSFHAGLCNNHLLPSLIV